MRNAKILYSAAISALLIVLFTSCNTGQPVKLVLLETTDVHGMIFPYDFIERRESSASMAGVSSYLNSQAVDRERTILLDNGDNLQGQPVQYYFNFIDTESPHLNARVMNYLGYDACTVGNHDIEAGHSVYDRLVNQYSFPLLAANAVNKPTGDPYFLPYTILTRKGIKIAVFGLVTPSVPEWLPPVLYSGIGFEDLVTSAKKWMPEIMSKKPDLVIGLFHTGWEKDFSPGMDQRADSEPGANEVAYYVEGFDVIFTGHDHSSACEKFVNIAGDTVLILNAGSRAEYIARADIELRRAGKDGYRKTSAEGSLVKVSDYPANNEFVKEFSADFDIVNNYVSRVIGQCTADFSSRDSYFGPSSYTGMIHAFQLEITGADVSFAAPLSFDAEIRKGPVTVSDMFRLYRFENMLYTISLTGDEIRKYLEYSYSGWLNTMKGPNDNMILFRTDKDGNLVKSGGRARLRMPSYNFDSAAGVEYTVDISKPVGERITIHSLSGGAPFKYGEFYSVAVNSYRGSGGGGHLTEGAGLSRGDLRTRLKSSTIRDFRLYIIRSVENSGKIEPGITETWKIIPAGWVEKAKPVDYRLMFGEKNN
jgi:2',3'-cyclic-nucleotide 2'-phosphodiesterase/3'-nucleotidase